MISCSLMIDSIATGSPIELERERGVHILWLVHNSCTILSTSQSHGSSAAPEAMMPSAHASGVVGGGFCSSHSAQVKGTWLSQRAIEEG